MAELIIAKQRNGPTGTIKLAFQKQYTRFQKLLDFFSEDTEASSGAPQRHLGWPPAEP